MLSNQAKRQGSFHVCAPCRRQPQQNLAHLLRARGSSIRSIRGLSLLSTTTTTTPTTPPRRPSPTKRRPSESCSLLPDDRYHHPHPTARRIDGARAYSAWGKFGSNTVPGQNNSAWGAALKKPGAASGPAPAVPAWGAGLQKPGVASAPAPAAPAWGAGLQKPGATSASAPAAPAWGAGLQKPGVASAPAPAPAPAPATPAWGAGFQKPGVASAPAPAAPAWGAGFQKPGATSAPAPAPAWESALKNSGATSAPAPAAPAWGAAFKKPGAASGPAPAPAWGGGLGRQIPRSEKAEKLRLSWEALTAPPKPEPAEPIEKQNSPDLGLRDNDGSHRKAEAAAEKKPPSFEDLFRRMASPSRPAPPGAEFPNLPRRESKASSFRKTSPFNLPPVMDDFWMGRSPPPSLNRSGGASTLPSPRSLDNRMAREPRDDGFTNNSPKRSGGWGNQWSRDERPPSGLSDDNRMTRESRDDGWGNQWSRDERPPSGLSDDNRMIREPRDDGFTDSSSMRSGDWGNQWSRDEWSPSGRSDRFGPLPPPESLDNQMTKEPPPSPDNSFSRNEERHGLGTIGNNEGTDSDFSENNGQSGEGRRTGRDAVAQTDDQEEEAAMIRRGRRDREIEKPKGKNKRRASRRNYEDDEDGFDDFDDFEDLRDLRYERRQRKEANRAAREEMAPKTMVLPEYITIYDLAAALRIKPKQFLRNLEELGFENLLPDSVMTGETAALVAAEYGFEASLDAGDGIDLKPRPPPEDPTTLPLRPPVVTIMGHVDHGKTSMLDWMRKSSIAAGEHGGITQHIGAFSVKLRTGKVITFLDTPGHAAFLNMRQRGAYVTDIVVLVVAVDDSVMPQTIEALKHAQNAKVPMIVAVNKVDLDPNRMPHVKQDLVNHGVEIEDYGGDVQVVGVSAKTGEGMGDLEETILTLSEILDLRAEVDGMAEGWVLEASTRKEGKAATILVKRGTLRVGDLIVAGTTYTRIRIMRNEAGVDVQEAPPGTAVEIFGGWSEPPVSGDMVLQAPDENKAQIAVEYRLELAERAATAAQKAEQELLNREKAEKEALEKELAELGEEEDEAEKAAAPVEAGPKIVNLIVRGDVMGSVEAVSNALMEIGNNEVRPRILRSAPGLINEGDVDLLATATGCLINFNTTVPGFIRKKAADAGVPILDHNIIYEVVDDVKKVLSRDLAPITSQRVLGEAEVLQIFSVNLVKRQYKNIAGVKVRTGLVARNGLYRVMRDGEKIFEGKLDALKEGKKNATEIRKGAECGMSFDGFQDFQAGDIIQHYEEVKEKRYL